MTEAQSFTQYPRISNALARFFRLGLVQFWIIASLCAWFPFWITHGKEKPLGETSVEARTPPTAEYLLRPGAGATELQGQTQRRRSSEAAREISYVQALGIWLMKGFQQTVSHVDGDRCALFPSCSTYGLIATQKHGIVWGSLLVVDRLYREYGGYDDYQLQTIVGAARLEYDPLTDNDWWITSAQDQAQQWLRGVEN